MPGAPPYVDAGAVLAAVDPAACGARHPRGVPPPRRRRVGDAAEALRRRAAQRGLQGDARPRRGPGDPQVGHLFPRQPEPRPAGRRRRAARVQRRDRRAARGAGLRGGDLASDRRRGGGLRERARTRGREQAGIVGCGVNGSWAGRCLAASGFADGVCCDVRPGAAEALAGELGWRTGALAEALACDVVVTVTPGIEPVVDAADLRPGQHLALLGADAHGKAEMTAAAIARCRLFCDQWEQASTGGELAGPVERGRGRSRRRHRPRRGPRWFGSRARLVRGDHGLRLDRPGDPGPRDRAGGARGARTRPVAARSVAVTRAKSETETDVLRGSSLRLLRSRAAGDTHLRPDSVPIPVDARVETPRGGRDAWTFFLPALAVVIALLTFQVGWGASLGSAMLYLGYEVAYRIVPGWLLYRVLTSNPGSIVRQLALGWALGSALEVSFFMASAAADVRPVFSALPLLVGIPAAIVLWRRRQSADSDRTPSQETRDDIR